MSDINDIFNLLKNNQYLINILSKNEEILKDNFEILFKMYNLQNKYLDSLKNEDVNIDDETFIFKIKIAHLSSYIIKYIIEQITKIYLYNTVIKKILNSSNVTFETIEGGQKGGYNKRYYISLLFLLFIMDSLITANDIVPHEYSQINLQISISEGIIPEAKPTIMDILDPTDNQQMLEMAKNYYQAFMSKVKIPPLTQIIITANLIDIFGNNKPSFMDIFLGTQKHTFLDFVNKEVPKINLIYKDFMQKMFESCDSIIKLSSYELTGELPLAFFKTLNKQLQEEIDNMLEEKTEITEQLEETLKKERTEIAVSEYGELTEPTYYESLLEQIQFSIYPKSSNELSISNTKKVPREKSAEIIEAIEQSVKEDINGMLQEIDKSVISKKYQKIMEKVNIDKENFVFETNEKIYLSAICKNAFSNPPLFKFNTTTSELFFKDRPQSRFHIDIIVQNIMYNAPKLLENNRDSDKREIIVSINEKAQAMFKIIQDFNNNINELLLETSSDDTIQDYSNKISSFFENQRNRAIEAAKSNPISEERQKLSNIRNIQDAKLQSEKIKSETEAEKIVAETELESRKVSHTISENEWLQFYDESKLVSNGIFNFTSTITNPIFNGFNVLFNNLITKAYTLLLLLIFFGAWRLGLVNAILNRVKRVLEKEPTTVSKKPQERIEDQTRIIEELTNEELEEYQKWRENLEDDKYYKDKADKIRQDFDEMLRNEEKTSTTLVRRGKRSKQPVQRGGTIKLKNKKTRKNKRITRNKSKKNKKFNKKNNKRHTKKII